MFRDPWFQIIDVTEPRGLSLADIARQEAEQAGVAIDQVRGKCQKAPLVRTRRAIYRRVRVERPDLTSTQVAIYMRKDGSTIRHEWRRMEAEQ